MVRMAGFGVGSALPEARLGQRELDLKQAALREAAKRRRAEIGLQIARMPIEAGLGVWEGIQRAQEAGALQEYREATLAQGEKRIGLEEDRLAEEAAYHDRLIELQKRGLISEQEANVALDQHRQRGQELDERRLRLEELKQEADEAARNANLLQGDAQLEEMRRHNQAQEEIQREQLEIDRLKAQQQLETGGLMGDVNQLIANAGIGKIASETEPMLTAPPTGMTPEDVNSTVEGMQRRRAAMALRGKPPPSISEELEGIPDVGQRQQEAMIRARPLLGRYTEEESLGAYEPGRELGPGELALIFGRLASEHPSEALRGAAAKTLLEPWTQKGQPLPQLETSRTQPFKVSGEYSPFGAGGFKGRTIREIKTIPGPTPARYLQKELLQALRSRILPPGAQGPLLPSAIPQILPTQMELLRKYR